MENFLRKIFRKENTIVEIKKLLKIIDLKVPIIIGGGAHKGETISKLKRYFPKSEIYAFEAIPELANQIKLKPKISVFNKALGEKNEKLEFNVNVSSDTSSFLDSDLNKKYYANKVKLDKKIMVECASLDTLLKTDQIKQPDVIKLDLQGYELYALRGAKETLANAKIVLTEVEFIPLYKNQPLFDDIDQYLKDNDFRFYKFFEIRETDGRRTFADAIFINNKFFNKYGFPFI